MTGDLGSRGGPAVASDQTKANERSIRRAYDLNGVTLAVVASDGPHAGFFDPILTPLRCPSPVAGGWMMSMSPAAAIEPPSSGFRIFEGLLPEGLHALMVEQEQERNLVVPGHFAVRFRRPARTTEIRFVPGKEAGLGGTAAFWMLDDLLAANGRHLLHGALLVDPATERSIALFAPSGTGKTTTALALARAGLGLAGDDALVLHAGDNRCGLWAIPRNIKVHRKTVALLPWLGPILTDAWSNDEQPFTLDALSSLVTLATPRPRDVSLVIALMPPNEVDHSVAEIAKPEALATIARDNLRIAPGGVDADDAAAFAALARLIAMTPVIALSVGPEPGSLSREIIGLG
jgi:hypothetical protein